MSCSIQSLCIMVSWCGQVRNPTPGQSLAPGQTRALDGGASGVSRNAKTGALTPQTPVPQVARPAGASPPPTSFAYRGAKGAVATAAVSPLSQNLVAISAKLFFGCADHDVVQKRFIQLGQGTMLHCDSSCLDQAGKRQILFRLCALFMRSHCKALV